MPKAFTIYLRSIKAITISAAKFCLKDSCILFTNDEGADIAAVPLDAICFVSEAESVKDLPLTVDLTQLYQGPPQEEDPVERAIADAEKGGNT